MVIKGLIISLICKCWQNVVQMSIKCRNVKDSQKIALFHNILSDIDTKFAYQTRFGWRTTGRTTFKKIKILNKLPNNLLEDLLGSLVKNAFANKDFLLSIPELK